MADVTINQLATINALSANNFIPISDGTSTTKLGTNSLFGFRNKVINGDMRVFQKSGTITYSGAGTTTCGVDRMRGTASGSGSWTMQQSTDVPAGERFYNSILLTTTVATNSIVSNDCYYFAHVIEGYNTADLAWGTANARSITISFWVKGSVPGPYSLAVMNTEFTRSYLVTYTINAANTWERKVITVPGDVGATSISRADLMGVAVVFDLGFASVYESSTSNTWLTTAKYALAGQTKLINYSNATLRFTGLQIEEGVTATPFEFRPFGYELSLCQRYYCKTYSYSVTPGTAGTTGAGTIYGMSTGTGNRPIITWSFPVEMVKTPAIRFYSPQTGALGYCYDENMGSDRGAYNNGSSSKSVNVYAGGNSSAGNAVQFHIVADAEY